MAARLINCTRYVAELYYKLENIYKSQNNIFINII